MTASLVSQLEKAGEGSRELDDSVVIAAFNGEMMDWWDEEAQQHVIKASDGSRVNVTPVTTSLDAALALAERLDLDGRNTLYAAMMNWKAHDPRGPLSQTLPLALCIAILKARANYQEKNNVG